jgi:ankyrin
VWVPDGLLHGVRNRGEQVVALATQFVRAGGSALHSAAREGLEADVRALLRGGAPVDAASENGVTPIFTAAKEGRTEVVRLLLAAGARLGAAVSGGLAVLHLAAQEGHACRGERAVHPV